ncbi:MAG TPA: hypothetical protein VG994_02685 [Steroidobacteraceae bacterium]|nr:hypothetical protein [Steroidobacteraceae bacterium]
MLELATLDRDAYREIRAEAWERVVANHGRKSPEEIEAWKKRAS